LRNHSSDGAVYIL